MDQFLITSPNTHNSPGIGITQLYNVKVVYNHKRHGEFKLCNRTFHFRKRPFSRTVTTEFLIIELLNDLDSLAEDRDAVLKKVLKKILQFKQG
jgi:hypothetical protein